MIRFVETTSTVCLNNVEKAIRYYEKEYLSNLRQFYYFNVRTYKGNKFDANRCERQVRDYEDRYQIAKRLVDRLPAYNRVKALGNLHIDIFGCICPKVARSLTDARPQNASDVAVFTEAVGIPV